MKLEELSTEYNSYLTLRSVAQSLSILYNELELNNRFYLEGHRTPYKAKDFRKIRYHWDIGSQYYIELTMKNHDVITIWHTYLEAEISGKYYSQNDLYRYFDRLSKGDRTS